MTGRKPRGNGTAGRDAIRSGSSCADSRRPCGSPIVETWKRVYVESDEELEGRVAEEKVQKGLGIGRQRDVELGETGETGETR